MEPRVSKPAKPRSRSRTGCFTCRRRKKKCDESSLPKCKNCIANKLECTWPERATPKPKSTGVDGLAEFASQAEAEILDGLLSATPPAPFYLAAESRSGTLDAKHKNYILERISMQQDCVDEDQGDGFFWDSSVSSNTNPMATTVLIRDRIAQQMEISEEFFVKKEERLAQPGAQQGAKQGAKQSG